jgi:hypothetical protein
MLGSITVPSGSPKTVLVGEPTKNGLSRRGFLGHAAATVVAALLGGCQSEQRAAPPAKEAKKEPRKMSHDESGELMDALVKTQTDYWQFNPEAKAGLVRSDPLQLAWPEALRLNHLCCLEVLETEKGRAAFQSEEVGADDQVDLAEGLDLDFWPDLLGKLVSNESPYRPRHCDVWQGDAPMSEAREPDLGGPFYNASLTHFGCLEVIRLDARQRPRELAFVPLDDLDAVVLAQPSLFRAAGLFYNDGREHETVWAPLLYGISWRSTHQYDRDGTFTRFVGHQQVSGLDESFGIGIGHQDFVIKKGDGGATLFGLGSVSQISVALEVADPRFDEKCRARGLGPEEVRRQIPDGH